MSTKTSSQKLWRAYLCACGLGLASLIGVASPAAAFVPEPACSAPGVDPSLAAGLEALAAQISRTHALRIAAIGSSSTFGIGATSEEKSYPAQLAAILQRELPSVDVTVLNMGVSGESSQKAADRISLDVMRLQPNLLIWQVGTVEGVSGVPVDEVENTVRETLEQLKTAGVETLLVDMQWTNALDKSDHYKAVNAALARAATAQKVPLVSRFALMRARAQAKDIGDMLSSDGFHLNDFGYRCMAEHIAASILARLPRRGAAFDETQFRLRTSRL